MLSLLSIISTEIPFHAEGRHPRSLMGKNFRSYLLDLRNTSTPFKGVRKALIDTLLDGYETARYGTGVSWMATFSFREQKEYGNLTLPLSSGLWPEWVPSLPGGPEWAGHCVSLKGNMLEGLVGEYGSAGPPPSKMPFISSINKIWWRAVRSCLSLTSESTCCSTSLRGEKPLLLLCPLFFF